MLSKTCNFFSEVVAEAKKGAIAKLEKMLSPKINKEEKIIRCKMEDRQTQK